ncbi:MAG: hypothetical protein E6K19_07085 [Methanobacteriota archaeon]|nr:MAG: hypothetical protein E6K19_07085 [Euryarchaeota archaeon]
MQDEKSFADRITLSSLTPSSGWSAQLAEAVNECVCHDPVGSSEVETARRTLLVLMSVIEANHRALGASKRTFGSLMKSVDGTPKNVSREKVWTVFPSFVQMRPTMFTISTTCRGPAATWTSGGATSLRCGPFAPNTRPSNDAIGTAAGVGPAEWRLPEGSYGASAV